MKRRWREPDDADTVVQDPARVVEAGIRNHHIANTAYPIAHDRTFGPYRVPRARHAEVAREAWEGIGELGLYVHVPFCETRCSFCEYTVVGRAEAGADSVRAYGDAMLTELDLWDRTIGLGGRTIAGLDIGGGTPSFVPASEIERYLDAIRARTRFAEDADISIETTPKIAAADADKLAAYKELGIDRISMGIQVVQPDLLRVLNRDENGVEHHHRAVENIRRASFTRFNVDLMYGFHGQTEASWEATLAHAIALEPEYITLYRMRYKLTRISHQAPHVTLEPVQRLGKLSKELLAAAGYRANPGKTTFSKIAGDVGTSRYLARRVIEGLPYLGIGLGAQTYTDTTISYNAGAADKRLGAYLRATQQGVLPFQDLYDLPVRHMMAKMACVSFYFGEIDRPSFARKFGVPLDEVFPAEIAHLKERGWMELTDRALSLTTEGAPWVNGVIPLFTAPSVQTYLVERDPRTASDMDKNRKLALRTQYA
jgi:oxygen-independent coproporphyrinogen III oxidase